MLPGSANFPIGVLKTANREIGAPRFQPTRLEIAFVKMVDGDG
jgi:hypothetical protein